MEILVYVYQSDHQIAKATARKENQSILNYQFSAQISDNPSAHVYGKTPEEAAGKLIMCFGHLFNIKIKRD